MAKFPLYLARPYPEKAIMVVSSGEVTKQCVSGLPSLRLAKLRLYEVTMVFLIPRGMWRAHRVAAQVEIQSKL